MNEHMSAPVTLDMPRVWRTYTGGALIDKLHRADACADSHFPEEWIMSVVAARNVGREHVIGEGLSHLSDGSTLKEHLEQDAAARLGAAHAAQYGAHPGILVKLLDSAERLAIQAHPDRNQAQRLFGAPFGKTECWHILDVRSDGDESPAVYIGFRPGITREKWEALFHAQDVQGMLGCMHRLEVQPGDTILVHAGVPHAIGAGCLLAEIQEPTDFTIRMERVTPGGYRMPDEACHQGVGFERMFDCFEYEGITREEAMRRWLLRPRMRHEGGADITTAVDYTDTPMFAMERLSIAAAAALPTDAFSALYVLSGEGELHHLGGSLPLAAPQQLFVPADAGELRITAHGAPLEILRFFGPEVK